MVAIKPLVRENRRKELKTIAPRRALNEDLISRGVVYEKLD